MQVEVVVLALGVLDEVHEQLHDLVLDLLDAGVRSVHLVDAEHDRQVRGERLAEHETGLRERALGSVHEQHDTVDHGQAALDLPAEVGVAGGVDDVDRQAVPRPALAAAGPA